MAEGRQPNGTGPRRRPGASGGAGASRAPQSRGSARPRRAAPPPKRGLSAGVIIALALPTAGIVALGGYHMFRDKDPGVVKIDENADLQNLIGEIATLEREAGAALKALRSEESGAKSKVDAFIKKAQNWQDRWEELTRHLRDESTGRWKPEYQGYEDRRKAVNTILLDVQKGDGFF